MRRAIDLSGTLLGGRYRLLRQLGVGSVGSLYESIDEASLGRRRVAVKVLRAQRLFEKDVTEAEVTERIPGTPAYMAPEQIGRAHV